MKIYTALEIFDSRKMDDVTRYVTFIDHETEIEKLTAEKDQMADTIVSWMNVASEKQSKIERLEKEIRLKDAIIQALSVDAATLNATLVDIINGKMEKQSAILIPDYDAYDSDEKKVKWAKEKVLDDQQRVEQTMRLKGCTAAAQSKGEKGQKNG